MALSFSRWHGKVSRIHIFIPWLASPGIVRPQFTRILFIAAHSLMHAVIFVLATLVSRESEEGDEEKGDSAKEATSGGADDGAGVHGVAFLLFVCSCY